MKIAIISDVHNNVTNLEKVLNFCNQKKIKTLICCGDLASIETLDFLNNTFNGTRIYFVFGNMDNDFLRNYPFKKNHYKKTAIYTLTGETTIQKHKIGFTHFPEEAAKMAQMKKYQLIFYGHTHKPWSEIINDCILLNPGNVAGEIYPATFAIWDTKENKFELIKVNDIETP